ncbi:hypothetical protein JQ581_12150 [Bradyrhizobium liaoningense]|uniref:hypothetical protein n=1 Tax=Bradyrhizobium liaoningense TaxID=43992 RepID=UPI001BAE2953|nr:hypothetical protein [Bradyrhizobium liaoningense]MBR0737678.1 hypothetical protein [Bradyrhizobium liaoningense]
MDFYLRMYLDLHEACIFAARGISAMQFVRVDFCAGCRKQDRQKFPRPSFGMIKPENDDATLAISNWSCQMGSPPVPATWGNCLDNPIDCAP